MQPLPISSLLASLVHNSFGLHVSRKAATRSASLHNSLHVCTESHQQASMPHATTTTESSQTSPPSIVGMTAGQAQTALTSWINQGTDIAQRRDVANSLFRTVFPTESRVSVPETASGL